MTAPDSTIIIIDIIRLCLAKGIDDPERILRILSKRDPPVIIEERQLRRYMADLYGGAYPDKWLDNFLSVTYPTMFKECVEDIKNNVKALSALGAPGSNNKVRISAITNASKIELDLISLINKGPSVRMMRNLKLKADRLAREVTEERKITKRNEAESKIRV